MTGARDPLAPLAALPGVADAAEEAREALGRAHRHRANLRGWPATAAEAAVRGARASAVLDGGALAIGEDGEPDPVLAGALRVSEALEGGATTLIGVWQRAPLQALARLHSLAAADLTDDEHLGRPRADPEVGPRLELLAGVLTGGSRVPAPVLAAVAHGELLTLAPFGSADGVVARGVARLVTIATGLDPHGLGVPEVYWMRRSGDYRAAARGFSSGTPDGLTAWLVLHCTGLHAGAREALQIAAGASG
ncbi:oxidoreductase [Mycobacterium sp. NPDC050041]|uniref:oxidoreductase n=1 Tax=Mycobacterium sp. NPDC050041 TaxID=3364293 RepID=UPI003C2F6C46